jgi:hypothetical protein
MEITSLIRVIISFLVVVFLLILSLNLIKKRSGLMPQAGGRLKVLDKIIFDNQNKMFLISVDSKEILVIVSGAQIKHIEL